MSDEPPFAEGERVVWADRGVTLVGTVHIQAGYTTVEYHDPLTGHDYHSCVDGPPGSFCHGHRDQSPWRREK